MAMDHEAQGMAAAALQKSRVALEVLRDVLENLKPGKGLDAAEREALLAKVTAALGAAS